MLGGVQRPFDLAAQRDELLVIQRVHRQPDSSGVDAGVPAYSPKSEEDKAGMKPLCAVIGVDVGVIGALYEPLDETEETDGVFGGGAIFW